jgi:Mn2+/Fe2+ NRAMP family transporter
VLGAAIALLPGNLIDLLINTQILNGIITPIILVFILILANRRSLLGDAANSPRFRLAATIAITAVAALALFVTLDTILGWFGGGWG